MIKLLILLKNFSNYILLFLDNLVYVTVLKDGPLESSYKNTSLFMINKIRFLQLLMLPCN